MPEVRRASLEDAPALAGVLARAFAEDSVAHFLFPDKARRARYLTPFFLLQLRHLYLPRGEVYTTPARTSVAMWMSPEPEAPRGRDTLAHFALLPMLGSRFLATRELAQFLARHHPRERHYYLGTLGTDPAARHQGLASALVVPVLEKCDALGLPAYLECSTRETVGFYERLGFVLRDEVQTPLGGPRLWLMARQPERH